MLPTWRVAQVSLLVALLYLVLGGLRLGWACEVLSKPIISAFLTAGAMIISLSQARPSWCLWQPKRAFSLMVMLVGPCCAGIAHRHQAGTASRVALSGCMVCLHSKMPLVPVLTSCTRLTTGFKLQCWPLLSRLQSCSQSDADRVPSCRSPN